jgi:hypothetical protein
MIQANDPDSRAIATRIRAFLHDNQVLQQVEPCAELYGDMHYLLLLAGFMRINRELRCGVHILATYHYLVQCSSQRVPRGGTCRALTPPATCLAGPDAIQRRCRPATGRLNPTRAACRFG